MMIDDDDDDDNNSSCHVLISAHGRIRPALWMKK
jgi:hypothetical protein